MKLSTSTINSITEPDENSATTRGRSILAGRGRKVVLVILAVCGVIGATVLAVTQVEKSNVERGMKDGMAAYQAEEHASESAPVVTAPAGNAGDGQGRHMAATLRMPPAPSTTNQVGIGNDRDSLGHRGLPACPTINVVGMGSTAYWAGYNCGTLLINGGCVDCNRSFNDAYPVSGGWAVRCFCGLAGKYDYYA
jgi:hypothetical protein